MHFLCFFLPTFTSSILSAMFTGACGPPEKLSLALVPRSYVLRMIVNLAYTHLEFLLGVGDVIRAAVVEKYTTTDKQGLL